MIPARRRVVVYAALALRAVGCSAGELESDGFGPATFGEAGSSGALDTDDGAGMEASAALESDGGGVPVAAELCNGLVDDSDGRLDAAYTCPQLSQFATDHRDTPVRR